MASCNTDHMTRPYHRRPRVRCNMTQETFAALAHRKLVGNRKWPIRNVAAAMSLSAESLYARLYGRTPFDPEEIRLLLGAVHDIELANHLLGLSSLIAVERSELASSPAESLQRGALKTLLDVTDIVRATEHALLDGHLDHREKAEIRRQVLEAERAVLSLKQLLDSLNDGH